jgi:AbiV family abortive infection protein
VPKATEETITASTARAYWRALVENVVSLIEDAALLLDQSPARARSLLILAQEETGKAKRLYVLAESAWTDGLPEVTLPKRFLELEGRHSHKIAASLEYGEELRPFWGDYSGLEVLLDMANDELRDRSREAGGQRRSSAETINREKQAGFYVDRVGTDVVTPQAQDVGDLVGAITRTAGVVEMLLITDHSRMKFHTPDRYDSTGALQRRLLPFSHPEEYFKLEGARVAAEREPGDG